MRERGGRTKAKVISKVDGITLHASVHEHVEGGSEKLLHKPRKQVSSPAHCNETLLSGGFSIWRFMSVRLGEIPIDASVSVRPTNDSSVYEAVLHCRFPGRHNGSVSGGTLTSITGDGTVLGKIVLTGDPLGHPQIIATALDAYRLRLESMKQDFIRV